jgi:cobalt/nickel transport system permease protein
MHISDGILTPEWIILWYVIAAIFIVVGIRQITTKRKNNPAYMSMLALLGAAVFVISVWHIPVPVAGSCSHPIGTPMAAMIIGPFPTVVIAGIALFFQMFLAHGGLTTLGANTISMGIAGTFVGFFTFLGLKKVGASIWVSAGLGALVGDLVTYISTALIIALAIQPSNVLTYWGIFTVEFLPTQIPLAIVELVFTAAAVQYIADRRPELLSWRLKKIG